MKGSEAGHQMLWCTVCTTFFSWLEVIYLTLSGVFGENKRKNDTAPVGSYFGKLYLHGKMDKDTCKI